MILGLVRWFGGLVIALALLSGVITAPSVAQSPAPAASADPPPQVRELLELLDEPAVREWLETQRPANQVPPAAALSEKARIEGYFAAPIAAIEQHFASLAATFPMLPADFEQAAGILAADLRERGLIEILLLLGGFVTLGFGAEWLFGRMTVAASKRISDLNLATVGDRLRAVAARLAFNTGLVVAFALGSVGAFLLFHWPPLLKEIVLGYLFAFLAVRLALVMGRVLLAPGGKYDHDVERFRIIPMSTRAARFWYQRLGLLVGWFAFSWVTLVLLSVLGFVREYLAALESENSPVNPGQAPKAMSPSDPAAAWTTRGRHKVQFAYSVNHLVDLLDGVIVDVAATPTRISMEVDVVETMLDRVAARFDLKPERITADVAYGTGGLLGELVARNIAPHIPVWDKGKRNNGTLSREDFRFEPERDLYLCPRGNVLKTTGKVHDGRTLLYRASKHDCDPCPLKLRCCPKEPARKIPRDVNEAARDLARGLTQTEGYRVSARQRKMIETGFADMKRNLGLTRLRLRGLTGANDEFLLAATVQNLRRLATAISPEPTTSPTTA